MVVRLGKSGGGQPGWSAAICGIVNVRKDTGVVVWLGEGGVIVLDWPRPSAGS